MKEIARAAAHRIDRVRQRVHRHTLPLQGVRRLAVVERIETIGHDQQRWHGTHGACASQGGQLVFTLRPGTGICHAHPVQQPHGLAIGVASFGGARPCDGVAGHHQHLVTACCQSLRHALATEWAGELHIEFQVAACGQALTGACQHVAAQGQLRTQLDQVKRHRILAAHQQAEAVVLQRCRLIGQRHTLVQGLVQRQVGGQHGTAGAGQLDPGLDDIGVAEPGLFGCYGDNSVRQRIGKQAQVQGHQGLAAQCSVKVGGRAAAGLQQVGAAALDEFGEGLAARFGQIGLLQRGSAAQVRQAQAIRAPAAGLIRRVERDPGLAGGIDHGAAVVGIRHTRRHPGMFQRHRNLLAAARHTAEGHAGLGQCRRHLGRVRQAQVLGHFFQRQFDHAVYITGGQRSGAQQRHQQRGLVDVIAAAAAQGANGALHCARVPGGFRVVANVFVNAHVIVAQLLGLGNDLLRQRAFRGGGTVFRRTCRVGLAGICGSDHGRQDRRPAGQIQAAHRQVQGVQDIVAGLLRRCGLQQCQRFSDSFAVVFWCFPGGTLVRGLLRCQQRVEQFHYLLPAGLQGVRYAALRRHVGRTLFTACQLAFHTAVARGHQQRRTLPFAVGGCRRFRAALAFPALQGGSQVGFGALQLAQGGGAVQARAAC